MSYCRWSDNSDVYVFAHVDDFLECHVCRLMDKVAFDSPEPINIKGEMHDHFRCDTPQEMIEHLKLHTKAGHKVPEYALERLKEEATQ